MTYTYNPDDKFGAKDTLAEDHPEKKILGVEFDEEFKKIAGAFAIFDPDGDGDIEIGNIDGLQEALDTERQERIDADADLQGQIDALDPSGGGFVEAPNDGKLYGRQSEAWAEVVVPDVADPDWSDIQNKPTEFPPSDHTHVVADITDFDPTDYQPAGDYATEQYVDDSIAAIDFPDGGNPVVISDDAPADPEEGDLWYCSRADQEGLYCWDGSVWFGTESPTSAGLEEAPEDGKQYARRNASWSEVATVNLSGYATEVYVDDAIAAIPLYDGSDAVKTSGDQTIAGTKTFDEDIRGKKNVIAYYSDIRLKDVQGPIENPLEKVKAIETFYYTHGDRARELGYEGSEIQVGVSAQSVQAVAPELIHRAPIDDDGEGGSVTGESYITVDYPRLVPLLIESIKQLSAEIEELKK